jgi:asparagine synthase (glutamine-hydrolysing)
MRRPTRRDSTGPPTSSTEIHCVSAICGLFHLDGRSATPNLIGSMSATLGHRGPDASGSWCDEMVALGHRMLHTTPESLTEVQPLVSTRDGLVLVADARIDNREDLIATLRLSRAPKPTDSQIILAAYARWGEECANRLIGDFALAIWSSRDRTLFCARDPMGVKPVYYVRANQLFAFASEAKALLAIPGVEAEIDAEQVALFLGWYNEDREKTLFRSVMRLPAAHTLVAGRDRLSIRRYWCPDPKHEITFRRDDDYVEAFRELFTEAVRSRLRSSHPVGATLSGGLDSSSIVCTSRQLRSNETSPLHTFSMVFPGLTADDLRLIDERPFMDGVVRQGGVQPHFLRGDEVSPLGDIDRVVWHLDEPHSAPNLYLHWSMYRAAGQSGVRVFLDGFDGDTALSHGFGRLTSLARLEKWNVLQGELEAFRATHQRSSDVALRDYVLPHLAYLARRGDLVSWLRAASVLARRFRLSRRELLTRYGLGPLLPKSLVTFASAMREDRRPDQAILPRSLARALRRHERRAAMQRLRHVAPTERAAHIEGLSQPLYQLTLEIADKSAAAFNVEPRYPFFDRRLIEFCLALPEAQKFAHGWPRLILRRAMDGILPPEIQWRGSKANLSPNFHRRFRAVDVQQSRNAKDELLSPFVRMDALRRLAANYGTSGEEIEMKPEALTLFRVSVLEAWLTQLSERSRRTSTVVSALSPVAA